MDKKDLQDRTVKQIYFCGIRISLTSQMTFLVMNSIG